MSGITYEITTVSNDTYITNDDDRSDNALKIYQGIINGFWITICIVLTFLILATCLAHPFSCTIYKPTTQNNSNNNHTNSNDPVDNNSDCKENKSEKAELPAQKEIMTRMSSLDINSISVKLAKLSILKTYLCNIYFYISLFCLFLCVFLGIVCVLYGFGQITELNVTHY